MYINLIFQFILVWYLLKVNFILAQSCPEVHVHTSHPCVVVQNWNTLVNIIQNGSDQVVLCPFNIQKPPSSQALSLSKSITAICREEGKCHISTSSFEQNGILKIGGSAKVVLYGFFFEATGTAYDTFSAVHIRFATQMKQKFCSCSFKGFRGQMRGSVLRSEPQTNIDLVDCKFEGNSSYDIGSIFNRGAMAFNGCIFKENYGKGGSIGSSRGSITVLANCSFFGNKGGVPIFFHGDDYKDRGGNTAFNNTQCNGLFVENNRECIPLDRSISVLPPSVPETSEGLQVSSCKRDLPNNNLCILVNNFVEFKAMIENPSGKMLIFCPFTIINYENEIAYISVDVQIICKESKKCIIIGSKYQVQIVGELAQVFFQGFVFRGATVAAVHVSSSANKVQSFCDCHFIENQGQSRGVGLLSDRFTKVEVISCFFQNNKSTDLGGSIFNRGNTKVIESVFMNNIGRGGAIGNAPRAFLILKDNYFIENKAGVPIFLHDKSYSDSGQNLAKDNSFCNGLWIDGARKCVGFQSPSNQSPTPNPVEKSMLTASPTSKSTTAIRGGIGYFNYNVSDNQYGPKGGGWGKVVNNPEYLRYEELIGTLQRSLRNKCNWNSINQSPIDLCEDKINKDCKEFHQTRTHSGSLKLVNQTIVKAQILPSKLRLKYYADRPPEGGPYPPKADFDNSWNGFAEVNHIDIKIPSEHSICGKHYPAEYSIYMLHPVRKQVIVMSILLAFHENDKKNNHLQKAIDMWQKNYDRNKKNCQRSSRSRNLNEQKERDIVFNAYNKFTEKENRYLKDETPFGRGGWDPFHPSLERTIYFWGYWGSLTEPPCSTFVAWRVLTEPAFISKDQLEQMKNILFSNQDKDCKYTSVNYKHSVARPIQPHRGRLLHKCTVNDYVSDAEKEIMRKKTGNPNWCC